MNKPRVFISHSSSNRVWARDFAKIMQASGVEVWFDELSIKPGDLISESIEEGLRGSSIVVLLVDKESLVRPNFFFELGAALGMNKKIVPIVSEDFETSKLPLPVQRKKYLIRKSAKETAAELITGLELLQGEAA